MGLISVPMRRALSFHYLMEHKTICIDPGELIVGEKGPAPKAAPTYPELCCHSLQDLDILDTREKIPFSRQPEAPARPTQDTIIPFWQGRSMRDLIFREMTPEWKAAYEAGIFTEFMEQRAPGHTVLDDKIYRKGMLDFKRDIQRSLDELDYLNDPQAYAKAGGAAGHAHVRRRADPLRRAPRRAGAPSWPPAKADPQRKAELERIAEVCTRVPAHAPRDFWEALQYYWFVHLGVTTELNTWDAFCPGHLDQHLLPVLPAGAGRRHADPRAGRRAAAVLLDQVQQPARPAQGGRDRGRERHLHRFRPDQHGRRQRRMARTASTRSPT